jgi:hypothetical protein
MFNTQILAGSSGQGGETQQSLKFNDDESQYLSWTPAADGNLTTWTWSGWVKRGNLINGTLFSAGFLNQIIFESDRLYYEHVGVGNYYLITTNKLRDTSSWYHLVFVWDTSNATSTDRMRIYINGDRVTNFDSAGYPVLNEASVFNSATTHEIGHRINPALYYLDGYLSDVHFIDGQALDPTSFGQFTNGYWEKIDYAGTYGTNGFHLTFQDDVVSEGFNVATYSGNGGTQSVSGLGLSPDLVWIKERSSTSTHMLADSVRGAGKQLESSTTGAEITSSAGSRTLSSFDADGFSVEVNNQTNENNQTYVGWCWDAGSGSPVSNTDGSITSTVKANPSYGFSIVSYTGTGANATVGHGLGAAAPSIVILKNRSIVSSWLVRSSDLAANQTLLLENTTTPIGTDYWQNTQPTSSVFSVSSNSEANGSGNNLVAYCFAEVAGYSSIGSYEGDGTTNGSNVVTLGFKPAFVMIKNADDAASWHMFDNTRDTVSPIGKYLTADTSDAESTLDLIEFTNTGFAPIFNGNAVNHTGETYIYMAFADTREAAFWKDVSGQGNHWTPNNLDYRDSLPDSPANNFATLNPLANVGSGSTLSEGNLQAAYGSGRGSSPATMGMPEGKWYWEATITATSTVPPYCMIGISLDSFGSDIGVYPGANSRGYGYYGLTGDKYNVSSATYGDTFTTGDIIGVAFDNDNGTLTFYKNGVSQGVAYSGLTQNVYFPVIADVNTTQTFTIVTNFGQDSTFSGAKPMGAYTDDNSIGNFQYAPPAGFLALCTANLPIPTIIDGSEHFDTLTWSKQGADNSTITLTGLQFQPDFVWAKGRSNAMSHQLFDAVRGTGKTLFSDTTDAEVTNIGNGYISSFNSDGFTAVSGSSNNFYFNYQNGYTYAAWNWKAGGTAVSNTDGSITSQVSANTAAGFSVLTFNGTGANATVGHGLGVAPSMVIMKQRNNSGFQWPVYHSSLGTDKFLFLQRADGQFTSTAVWQNTAPSSSVIYLGANGNDNNNTGSNMVAYCFADVEGFIKTGTYVGTGAGGANSGPFAYCGFRPALVIIKQYDAARNWSMYDSRREPTNDGKSALLYPNLSNAEYNPSSADQDSIDFLSNGFKLQSQAPGSENVAGGNYLFIAFASTPFKYANAR